MWGNYELRDVRTINVEPWLRHLPLAKSSCAKVRNVMSVLFENACRYRFRAEVLKDRIDVVVDQKNRGNSLIGPKLDLLL